MSINKDSIVRRWFEKAENDLKNIENNLRADDPPSDTICFHSQQAVEKYLKGALVYFDQEVTKTHDLVKLLTEVSPFIPELLNYEEELEKLTEFAVEARYPDTFYDLGLSEARESYNYSPEDKRDYFKAY